MRKIKVAITRCISLLMAVCCWRKILNLSSVLFSYLSKSSRVMGLPCIVQIEPTNRCDLQCQLCLTGLGKLKRSKGDMKLENYKQIIDQLDNSLVYLALYNMGESLLNLDIYQMIDYAKEKNIFTRLSTNANFSGSKNISKILDSGLDELIISLDCATAETYLKFKNSADFKRVIDNIRNLVKQRGRRSKPFISLQFLIMKLTEKDIKKFKNLVNELDVDQGLMKKVRIDFYNAKAKYDFLPENKKYIRDIYKGRKQRMLCWRPWLSTLILWDTTVVPCCYDMEGEFNFGNINSQSISSIWNNKQYMEFRKKIVKNLDSPKLCRQCSIKDFRTNFI